MSNKTIVVGILFMLLLLGGGGAWLFLHQPTVFSSHKPYIRQLNLKSFVLSVRGQHGAPHYLVINMSTVITSHNRLRKTWADKHTAMLRAGVLSAMLRLPGINEAIAKRHVRTALKASVRQAVLRVVRQTNPHAIVSNVNITKLFMQ
ncbi:hypothetical protein HAP94_02040 [Acidithiobacillus ferrivorans]|nr:hypothetical protein [Acidithiobacillus ferrivorans]